MTTNSTRQVFALATSIPPSKNAVAQAITTEAGMTITVNDPCQGKATLMAESMKEILEYAGIAGAEHAAKGWIAKSEQEGRHTSVSVDHTPPQKASITPCRHANFGLTPNG